MMLLKVFLFCLVSKLSSAKSNGAPSPSCSYMLPGHVSPQGIHGIPINQQPKETSRYIINATWAKGYRHVRLTITGSELKGFLIQARESENGKAVGSFNIDESSNETKYQNCTGEKHKFNPKASITHGDPSIKQNVTVLWEPPQTRSGNVTFYATIAQSFRVFWLKLPSNTIDLSESMLPTPTSDLDLTNGNSSSTGLFNRQMTYSAVTASIFLTSVLGLF